MARRRRGRGERHWREVIHQQKTSGLSIAAFCREHNVPPSSFYQWKRKLKGKESLDKKSGAEKQIDPPAANARFVPLNLPPGPRQPRTGCEVVLPDGCRILVPNGCDASWLGELLDLLAERSC